MRNRLVGICCVCTLMGLICPSAAAEGDFIAPAALVKAGLSKYWQLRLPLDPGQLVQDVYLVDEHLYVGTQDGYVYAIHAPTGVIRWLRPVTGAGYTLRRPCHDGERVIFVTPTDVQIYERRSGDPISRRSLRFPTGTPAVSDGLRIFVGGLDRRLYALDAQTQFLSWRVITGGPIAVAPALHGDHVYFANDVGEVYACTREDKALLWHTSVYDRVSADLVASEEGVYVASRDFSLYLLDLNYGNVRWRARFSGPLYEAPVVTRDTVFQYCPADGLVAVETTVLGVVDDRLRWKLPEGRLALTVHEQRVYALTTNESIASIDLSSGTVIATIPAPGCVVGAAAPDDSTVLVAAKDGRLFCARPRGVRPLRQEDLLEALRRPTPEQKVAASGEGPTTRPVTSIEQLLETKRVGKPVGGKSKVSREFSGQ